MSIKSIKHARDLAGKRVLVRVDFNVPVKGKKVLDDSRLHASLPTIKYLMEKKAKAILLTHLGRPDGKAVKEFGVKPIADRLSEILNKKVIKLRSCEVAKVREDVLKMKNGDVVMLENVRFSSDEKKDTGTLSKDLASLADIFVLDGFGVAHRASASVTGVAKYLPSYAGLLLEKEIEGLSKVTENPKKPFVVVLGGVKIETKIPILQNLLKKADHILIGGGLVNTYLAAKGYKVGGSLIDKDYFKDAIRYCGNKKVIKPVDLVIGDKEGKKFNVRQIDLGFGLRDSGYGIYDIGPETIRLYAKYIKQAKTIVWNGAMGYFEQKPYDAGTLAIARLVASRSKGKAFGVIGGGETLQAMDLVGMKEDVDLVSTGGGAMLEYLAGKELPGIAALEKNKE
ncbi:MAG: phosphoglycerate kinase [Patescibacteria group bacterium]